MIKITSKLAAGCAVALCLAAFANAETRRKNPSSKLYVADQNGDTQIDTGTEIDDLTKKSVFNAEGTVIETKVNSNSAIVLSNGTGIFVDATTNVRIRTFQQEAFRPNRSDLEDEPSVSTTHLVLDHGVIGISTSKLVAGSKMVYDTSLATATIHGRQAVIQATDNLTVISMFQGEATVQAGPLDRPHEVKNHQQIIVRPGKPGEANIVVIQDIPEGQIEDALKWVADRVQIAENARKLVYFEVVARKSDDGAIYVFDGSSTADGAEPNSEIVPVSVVPASPTVPTNVSPANLTNG